MRSLCLQLHPGGTLFLLPRAHGKPAYALTWRADHAGVDVVHSSDHQSEQHELRSPARTPPASHTATPDASPAKRLRDAESGSTGKRGIFAGCSAFFAARVHLDTMQQRFKVCCLLWDCMTGAALSAGGQCIARLPPHLDCATAMLTSCQQQRAHSWMECEVLTCLHAIVK